MDNADSGLRTRDFVGEPGALKADLKTSVHEVSIININ